MCDLSLTRRLAVAAAGAESRTDDRVDLVVSRLDLGVGDGRWSCNPRGGSAYRGAEKPGEIRAPISASGDLEIGEYGYLEAQWVERSAREADLPAIFTNTTRYETVIVDRDQSAVLLIEDVEEHERTVREMIPAGVPVTHLAID